MHGAQSEMDLYTRKLLGFTDNRQDAALQAGHFNDFLFVSLVRAGFLGALHDAGATGLRSDELGIAMQRTLGFDRPDAQIRAEWLSEPSLRGFNLQEAEGTLRRLPCSGSEQQVLGLSRREMRMAQEMGLRRPGPAASSATLGRDGR